MARISQENTGSDVQTCSVQGTARPLDSSVSMVHKIFCNILHYYPYIIAHIREFSFANLAVRDTFALEFLTRMKMGNE